ncbi:MAG: SUMF1/EgtB/PvdO family nonheme iron enzyme [Myxococcales bacterium]|nr:SUMF1/EgtB/PvdO family nonheme iron enzyme [Myxococcales bacterium]
MRSPTPTPAPARSPVYALAVALGALVACGAALDLPQEPSLTTASPVDGGQAPLPLPSPPPPDAGSGDAGPTDAAADAADAADAARCPTGMIEIGGSCMDRYEAPNEAGARPLAFKTAPEGEAWCVGRGKRLCTETEWVRACEGPSGNEFPYGDAYRRGACNDDKSWRVPNWTTLATYPSATASAEAARLYQADPSGARAACVSSEGVHDLPGNVAEWVVRTFPHASNHEHVLKGCYWAGCYGGAHPSCASANSAHPGAFRTYEAGFRCCLTP